MKKSFVEGVSPERVAALRKSPRVVLFLSLANKVKSGSATPSERAEYMARTKRAREIDPNVLVD